MNRKLELAKYEDLVTVNIIFNCSVVYAMGMLKPQNRKIYANVMTFSDIPNQNSTRAGAKPLLARRNAAKINLGMKGNCVS